MSHPRWPIRHVENQRQGSSLAHIVGDPSENMLAEALLVGKIFEHRHLISTAPLLLPPTSSYSSCSARPFFLTNFRVLLCNMSMNLDKSLDEVRFRTHRSALKHPQGVLPSNRLLQLVKLDGAFLVVAQRPL